MLLRLIKSIGLGLALGMILLVLPCQALDVPATVTALHFRNSITGGLMPLSDPMFAAMVAKIQAGDLYGGALIAAQSKYFANYLARRIALQMQSPSLDVTGIPDNDASAFLIAHFVGAGGTPPRISTILSENSTYLVMGPDGTAVHAADLSVNDVLGDGLDTDGSGWGPARQQWSFSAGETCGWLHHAQ